MSSLSTHVLDTSHGCPAAGVAVCLSTLTGELLASGETDADGRWRHAAAIESGRYRLAFEVAAYFRDRGVSLPEPPFLDTVAIEFGIADARHHHVPLLVSPFAYSTYRGS